MKQLTIKVETTESGELSITTEHAGLSPLEVLGLIEQVKFVILTHEPNEDANVIPIGTTPLTKDDTSSFPDA